ncbi:hypothetical protein RS130_22010 [Paraglaciecola aquimarina]|uniref:LysR family transcriptional regulator n=1 Tax=Paraglaciecola aquimarina TaxID=1235557 RepID=A0ABU3T1W6_9ALTE|nr:hypothetical protein [Paraglaciecola aquimarina]MDU0356198.1 hypothetical protein [Paraglaciecola aquimarina]
MIEIPLAQSPEAFDVVAAWHPRYNNNALQKWVLSTLQATDGMS